MWGRGRISQVVSRTSSLNVYGINFHCVSWAQWFKVARIIGLERKRWIFSEQRFIGSSDTGWIQMFDDRAPVHVAAHHVSPKSPFLNTPRELILYLIHPIEFLTWVPLFPQLSVLAPYLTRSFFPSPCSLTFFAFVPLFANCYFVWNLLKSIFYISEHVFFE